MHSLPLLVTRRQSVKLRDPRNAGALERKRCWKSFYVLLENDGLSFERVDLKSPAFELGAQSL